MRTVVRFLACAAVMAGLVGLLPLSASAGTGKDFPNTKCTCQKCEPNGGDTIGQCDVVCKDKTVYSKRSEPYDYCKKE